MQMQMNARGMAHSMYVQTHDASFIHVRVMRVACSLPGHRPLSASWRNGSESISVHINAKTRARAHVFKYFTCTRRAQKSMGHEVHVCESRVVLHVRSMNVCVLWGVENKTQRRARTQKNATTH